MKLFRNLLLTLAVSSVIFFCSEEGFLKRLEQASYDFCIQLREPQPYNPRIIIIEITDADIAKVGKWPWKRLWHAAMTKTLTALGAKSIYFDIIFSEYSDEQDDVLFEEAIKSCQNVYLPFVFQDQKHDIKSILLPIPEFNSHIKGTGAINIYPDADGTVRKIPLIFISDGNAYPHIPFKIAMDYLDTRLTEFTAGHILFSNRKLTVRIPLTANNMLINWLGKWQKTFKHYDYLDVMAAYQDLLQHKKPQIDIGDFKNSICLIGVTGIGLSDIKSIPGQPEYPSIGIIATTISNILDRGFIFYPPPWIKIILF